MVARGETLCVIGTLATVGLTFQKGKADQTCPVSKHNDWAQGRTCRARREDEGASAPPSMVAHADMRTMAHITATVSPSFRDTSVVPLAQVYTSFFLTLNSSPLSTIVLLFAGRLRRWRGLPVGGSGANA